MADTALLYEIGGAVVVFAVMAAVYVFMLRGVNDTIGARGKPTLSHRILAGIAGERSGPELVSGLLAVLCLATLTAKTGAAVSNGVAGAGIAVLAIACRVVPTWTMVKLPVHVMYSVLGFLGALAAARDYLFPLGPVSGGGLLMRWVLLALVWSFLTFGTFAGFAAGNFPWKVGLLLFSWTELVIYVTVPLEMSELDNPLLFIGVLVVAVFFGVVGTIFRDLVELTTAVVMTLGSVALMAGEAGISDAGSLLRMTGPMMTMILTFFVVFAVLRALSKRWQRLPALGRKQ